MRVLLGYIVVHTWIFEDDDAGVPEDDPSHADGTKAVYGGNGVFTDRPVANCTEIPTNTEWQHNTLQVTYPNHQHKLWNRESRFKTNYKYIYEISKNNISPKIINISKFYLLVVHMQSMNEFLKIFSIFQEIPIDIKID